MLSFIRPPFVIPKNETKQFLFIRRGLSVYIISAKHFQDFKHMSVTIVFYIPIPPS